MLPAGPAIDRPGETRMKSYKGKTALVTGASSGIGKAFAHDLASRGARVIITARSEPALQAVAAELRGRYSTLVDVIPMDLSKAGAAARLMAAVDALDLKVDLLVNNAGFGKWGDFLSIEAPANAEMIQLNVTALVELCRLCLPGMLTRDDGGIINVASTAAFVPLPYAAVYSAAKTFVLYFSEALWGKTRKSGVHVMALCPGGTASNFAAVAADLPGAGAGRPGLDSSESVAKAGLDGFLKRKTYLITGKGNQRLAWLPRLMSRQKVVTTMGDRWKTVVDQVAVARRGG
jgi:short-subunit dehydrogenase